MEKAIRVKSPLAGCGCVKAWALVGSTIFSLSVVNQQEWGMRDRCRGRGQPINDLGWGRGLGEEVANQLIAAILKQDLPGPVIKS